jgi:hypothetical protein
MPELAFEQEVRWKFIRRVITGHRAMAALLAVCAAALLFEAYHLGLTIDEPSHFAAGYAYWVGQDVLVPPDTPPLTRIISGWVPIALRVPRPQRVKTWASQDAYLIGPEIFRQSRGRAHTILFCTRIPFLAFPLLIVFLVWYWSRELFGPGIAVILALAARSSPP